MPPRNRNLPTEVESTAMSADVMSDEERRQLLQEQAESLPDGLELPRLKIMPAGAGLFEFSDDPEDTRALIEAVVLSFHPRHVLWDSQPGEQRADGEGPQIPACASPDGKEGTPRAGFLHLALGGEANGNECISCKTCRYNEFETAGLVGRRGKGKACTNQSVLYLLIEGRPTPIELTLSPTSITAWAEYVKRLTTRGKLVRQSLTRFTLERKQRDATRWSEIRVELVRELTAGEYEVVKAARTTFARSLAIADPAAATAPTAATPLAERPAALDESTDAALPF